MFSSFVMPSIYLLDAIALVLAVICIRAFFSSRGKHYPPGPQGYPLVGSLGCASHTGHTYFVNQLAEQYAHLIRERGTIRIDWTWVLGTLRFGTRWKRHRRAFDRPFRESQVHLFWDIQQDCAKQLVVDLSRSPKEFMAHLRLAAARATMKITYGINVKDMNNKYVDLSEQVTKVMTEGTKFFLVNFIPALKWVPEWVPGAGFQRKAKEWKRTLSQMRDCPFAVSQASPVTHPTFVSQLMGGMGEEFDEDIEIVRNAAGQAYIGGVDSLTTTLAIFLRALTLFPETQKKAQLEIDNVCVGRLPTLHDRKSLPQVDALLRELLRWHPVAPLGVPHSSTKDDVYNGHFIPGGSLIIANMGRILSDPEIFPDPLVFNPDRFVDFDPKGDILDPRDIVFGFGKRICPGRFLGDSFLWICIASILAAFEIKPIERIGEEASSSNGVFTTLGFLSQPYPFECSFVPRSGCTADLLSNTADSDPWS
ncbi:hypothetical protein NLI96_g5749 [Meripilus lineatus]|uniref:Cytochrome P450 n=1 Tax=Meripilus lineatus TaxID=2056292 RepID=A0AAD5V497_9APHY|nr:hypothetical protein NLI96_g5749 [Physisporinus lineatus]